MDFILVSKRAPFQYLITLFIFFGWFVVLFALVLRHLKTIGQYTLFSFLKLLRCPKDFFIWNLLP